MQIYLWEIRKKRNLTERELAELTGLSKSTINNIENGKTSPNLAELEVLAKVLEVGMVDLFDSKYKYARKKRRKALK